jgi:hypothetical protein
MVEDIQPSELHLHQLHLHPEEVEEEEVEVVAQVVEEEEGAVDQQVPQCLPLGIMAQELQGELLVLEEVGVEEGVEEGVGEVGDLHQGVEDLQEDLHQEDLHQGEDLGAAAPPQVE